MAEVKYDVRSIRTDKAIRRALEEMLVAGIKPIKVTELARRAGISRKTFYSHYDTVEDLINSYIQDVEDELHKRLNAHKVEDYLSQRGLLVGVFADFFMAKQRFYTSILFQGEYWASVQRIQDELLRNFAHRVTKVTSLSADEATLMVIYASNTILTMLRLRNTGQVKMSVDEICQKTTHLNNDGLRSVMDLEI